MTFASQNWTHPRFIILTFAMSKRRSAGGCSRPYFGSFVMRSTPTATMFFIFILQIVLMLVEDSIDQGLQIYAYI
jgi:hypothetical protein